MKVLVVDFTEHDLDFTGRVFLNEEKLKEELSKVLVENDMSLEAYIEDGFISWNEVTVEGFGDTVVPFTFTITEPDFDDCDPRGGVELTRDDGEKPKSLFRVYEGEPEDMNLGRDLCDCTNVETLLELGHALALEGKGIDVMVKTETEE